MAMGYSVSTSATFEVFTTSSVGFIERGGGGVVESLLSSICVLI